MIKRYQWLAIMNSIIVSVFLTLSPIPARSEATDGGINTPTERAIALVAQMTIDEKVAMVSGMFGTNFIPGMPSPPSDARGGDGFVPGVPRLGIPNLNLIGAGLGVTDLGRRQNGPATALPSSLAIASSFDIDLAGDYGALIGEEARRKGFNVSLGGAVNLTRDPRSGRAFENHGEDPVLAGLIGAAELRGTESQGVVATIKHYALNDIENGRFGIDVNIDERAMRESELLAFELVVKQSQAGAVMCAYNLVNGVHACENSYLLNELLKKEWGFKGWVMSDWGGVHSTSRAANAGLDQEFYVFKQHYGNALKQAVEQGKVTQRRLDDMVVRILSQLARVGVLDHEDSVQPINNSKGASIALRVAEAGSVLLKNDGILPLERERSDTIAVIGFNADKGVLTGGGSSQVNPIGGNAVPPKILPTNTPEAMHTQVWVPSSPLTAIREKAKGAKILWEPGIDPTSAAKAAADADMVILFAGRWRKEGADLPDLSLGGNQDAIISAVASVNPAVIVVLETGGAHLMPWIDEVKGVLETWYPGQRGGEAIANILFGDVNPSGKLPLTFPLSETDLPRPILPGPPLSAKAGQEDIIEPIRSETRYDEGALVGYKWYDAREKQVLFPFGHGLSYTDFSYSNIKVTRDEVLTVSFEIANTGKYEGTEVAQVYVEVPGSGVPRRLAGWARLNIEPGSHQRASVTLEPAAMANWDSKRNRWVIPAGKYVIRVGSSSRDFRLSASIIIE